MKTAKDPRHQARRQIVKSLFAESFTDQKEKKAGVEKILAQKDLIDAKIREAAPTWPIDKLNRVDLAVLRLAVFEMEQKQAPTKVIIDEAVELAKEFGSENSASFVNGVLGTIYKDENDDD